MVWHDKPNRAKDDWETYAHEREAPFDFLVDNKIGGVVLLGGDVHVSPLLEHLPAARLGYPIFEYIVSPLHDRVIPSLVPTKDKRVIWPAVEPQRVPADVADTTGQLPTLTSTWIKMDGTRLHEHAITLERSAARPGSTTTTRTRPSRRRFGPIPTGRPRCGSGDATRPPRWPVPPRRRPPTFSRFWPEWPCRATEDRAFSRRARGW